MMGAQSTAKLDRETKARIQEWLHRVRGHHVGEKRRAVYQTLPYDWMDASCKDDALKFYGEIEIETEDMLVLEIPVRELATMSKTQEWYQQNIGGYSMEKFDKIIRDKHNEEYLRAKHIGLQEAWEQYQIMLGLCSTKTFK